jgi:hypothetical protein
MSYYDDVEAFVVDALKTAYIGQADILIVPSAGVREVETLQSPRVISVIVNQGKLTRSLEIDSEDNESEDIEVVLLFYAAANPPKDGRSKVRDMLIDCRDALRGQVPATGCDRLYPTSWNTLGTLNSGVLMRQVWATAHIG